jgi:alkaline phosphatase D
VHASIFRLPTIATRSGYEIALANFTVKSGENRLSRTNGAAAGGVAEMGALKFVKVVQTNLTNNTTTGLYLLVILRLILRNLGSRINVEEV